MSLRGTARIVGEEFGDKIPSYPRGAGEAPSVGFYTVGAVAYFAFEKDVR